MVCLKFVQPLLLLTLLDLFILTQAREICLTAPFITGISEIKIDRPSDKFNLTFLLQSNYNQLFKVEGVVLNDDITVSDLSSPIITLWTGRSAAKIYGQQSINALQAMFDNDNLFVYNIISETKSNPLVFQFTADGYLKISKYLGGDNFILRGYYLAGMPSRAKGPFLFESEFCKNIISNKSLYLEELSHDYLEAKPLKTLTKWGDNNYIGFHTIRRSHNNFQQERVSIWSRTDESSPYEFKKVDSNFLEVIGGGNERLEALSIAKDGIETWQLRAVTTTKNSSFARFFTHKLNHEDIIKPKIYLNLSNVTANVVNGYDVPLDVTHWTTCRKVVALYLDFKFTLNEYNESINSNYSARISPEKTYLPPITALHAEGDEFYFMAKATTVVKMTADSTNCSTLRFRNKIVMNIRQMFEPNAKVLMVEGRYYDGEKWIPPWDSDVIGEGNQTPILLFLSIGVAIFLFTIFIVVFFLLKSNAKNDRGEVIYSNQGRISKDNLRLYATSGQSSVSLPGTGRSTLDQVSSLRTVKSKKSLVAKSSSGRKLSSPVKKKKSSPFYQAKTKSK